MTRVHSALAAALMVFGGATIAAAQQATPPAPQQQVLHQAKGQHARRAGAKRMLKGVQLSAAERTNLKAVHQKYEAQRKALRGSSTVDKSQLQALRKSERNDLRGALSPDNQAKFDANVAAMQGRAARRGKPVKP
jgi:Spy/CpxP family protein refolding chaperone